MFIWNLKSYINSYENNSNDKNNLVYNVHCNDCSAVYVGQTKRKLSHRLSEHKKSLLKLNIKSNVRDHAKQCKHNINFENAKITYFENNYHARLFLESWNIEKLKYVNIPLMNDRQNSQSCSIPEIYLSLLHNE